MGPPVPDPVGQKRGYTVANVMRPAVTARTWTATPVKASPSWKAAIPTASPLSLPTPVPSRRHAT
jgi:hypothetical protein